MNSLIRLLNIIFSLGDSLERTKALTDTMNARLEQALGLTEPPIKLLDVAPATEPDAPETTRRKAKA